jgi:hypothetical protein
LLGQSRRSSFPLPLAPRRAATETRNGTHFLIRAAPMAQRACCSSCTLALSWGSSWRSCGWHSRLNGRGRGEGHTLLAAAGEAGAGGGIQGGRSAERPPPLARAGGASRRVQGGVRNDLPGGVRGRAPANGRAARKEAGGRCAQLYSEYRRTRIPEMRVRGRSIHTWPAQLGARIAGA